MKTYCEELEEKIASLSSQLSSYEKQLQNEMANGPEAKLAVLLHDKLCIENHTDGCDWHYGFDKLGNPLWEISIQQKYLKKSRSIIKKLRDRCSSDEDVFDLIKCIIEEF